MDPFKKDQPGKLVVVTSPEKPLSTTLSDGVREAVRNALSANTRRAYAADRREWEAWCTRVGRTAYPAVPETVAAFLVEQSKTRKLPTLEHRLAAISKAHEAKGFPSPTRELLVRTTLEGIRRERATPPVRKKALGLAELRKIVPLLPLDLEGAMNKALLLVGFAGGFRRSELAGIDVEHLRFVEPKGVAVYLAKSKTDQERRGRFVPIRRSREGGPLCPVTALQAWLAQAGITAGPVFKSVDAGWLLGERITEKGVARVVKRAVKVIGLEPSDYGGHSLRAGLVTESRRAGAPGFATRRLTGHSSDKILDIYDRPEDLFEGTASDWLDL